MFLIRIHGYLFQLIATSIGCLLTFSYGILIGISPSHIKDYQLEETPLNKPINKNDAHWITLYIFIGGAVGSVIFGFSATKFGRKAALMTCGIFQVTSWFCIAFGYNVTHINLSRFFAGLSVGGTLTVLPVYISEITEKQSRGNLQCFIVFFQNIGIIFGLIIIKKIHYDYLPLVGVLLSSIFTLSFPFVQESPYFYLMKNEINLMEKSLRWFRAIRSIKQRNKEEFLDEIEEFKNLNGNLKFTKSTFCGCNKRLIKIFIISFVLIINIQLSNFFIILNQFNDIFTKSINELHFEKDTLNIITASFQGIGSFFAILIVGSRKKLITFCSIVILLSMSVQGAMLFLQENKILIETEIAKWISLGSLWSSVFFINFGLYPISFVILTEILPYKKKTCLMSMLMAFQWIVTFVLEMYFDIILSSLNAFGFLWIIAGFFVFEAAIIILTLPETQDKSFEEIQNIM